MSRDAATYEWLEYVIAGIAHIERECPGWTSPGHTESGIWTATNGQREVIGRSPAVVVARIRGGTDGR